MVPGGDRISITIGHSLIDLNIIQPDAKDVKSTRATNLRHQAQTTHATSPPPVTRLVVDTYMHHHRHVSMGQLTENSYN